jgi:hypothetical protein
VPRNHTARPSSLASAYGRVPISMAFSLSVGPCLFENLRLTECEVYPPYGPDLGTFSAHFGEHPKGELRGISLPRTPVNNKGKEKGRGCYYAPAPTGTAKTLRTLT